VLRKSSDVALWPLNCTNTSSLAGKHRVKSDSILTLSCRLTKAAVSDCTRDAFQAASTAPFCLVAPQEGKKQGEEDERRGEERGEMVLSRDAAFNETHRLPQVLLLT
jgi:hypothetical protein